VADDVKVAEGDAGGIERRNAAGALA
jgi:hypothetical protein